MSSTADPKTLEVYAQEAANYARRDRSARATGFLEPFMALLPAGGTVLDLGCGAGWAAEIMQARGFETHALDATPEFAALAQAKLRTTVRVMAFEGLDDVSRFDGIWASGSLLHAPKAELPGILARCGRALRPGGLLMATFKAGDGESRDKLGRFFAYYRLEELRDLVIGGPGLQWDGHLEASSVDFAGITNTVYAIKARRTPVGP